MGEEDQKEEKIKIFDGYQVSSELCSRAKPDYKFMHCLPRKPEEVCVCLLCVRLCLFVCVCNCATLWGLWPGLSSHLLNS